MCTRVVYSGSNGMVATGRSMDWKTEMHSNLWVFPRGMKRNGETGENSLEWTGCNICWTIFPPLKKP